MATNPCPECDGTGEVTVPGREWTVVYDPRLGRMEVPADPYVCDECNGTGEADPTPWCHGCGAMTKAQCKCGPIAETR